jgi:pyruvate/2-oxoglutarate dehydrogenase complex dihydrolipoamide acyltransferase (E2) component
MPAWKSRKTLLVLIPVAEVNLSFDTGGELVEILVEVGDEVEAGQVLARLDRSSAETKRCGALILNSAAPMTWLGCRARASNEVFEFAWHTSARTL